jgi:hypothetical protein
MKKIKLYQLPVWVLMAFFMFAGCQKDEVDEAELFSSEMELKKGDAEQNKLLAQLRQATAKYHNYDRAIADGFFLPPGGHCVSHPELGAMGFHYINPNAGLEVNPANPQVLIYEPTKNGKMRLVGVEFIVPYDIWNMVYGEENPPVFGNQSFEAYPNAVEPFPNYQLHVWLWKHNPNGIFFPFNPNVTCEYAH